MPDFKESFDLNFGMEMIVSGVWTPARPAPSCSNPDSSKFGDPGDPAEVEVKGIAIHDGHSRTERTTVKMPAEFSPYDDAELEKAILERIENKPEPEYEDE